MQKIPNPNEIFPNEYRTSCFIKNVIKAPNILLAIIHTMMITMIRQTLRKIMFSSIIRNLATD